MWVHLRNLFLCHRFSIILNRIINFVITKRVNKPSRQLTVHWQHTMLKFYKESDFHLSQSQNCLLGREQNKQKPIIFLLLWKCLPFYTSEVSNKSHIISIGKSCNVFFLSWYLNQQLFIHSRVIIWTGNQMFGLYK